MRTAVMTLALAACGSQSLYEPNLVLDEAFLTCEVAADCTMVELGCCDRCNGGQSLAVRTDKAEEVERDYSETCPARAACTLLDCSPVLADCVANLCTAVPAPPRG